MADIDQKLILELTQMLLMLICPLLLFKRMHNGQCKAPSSNHPENHCHEQNNGSHYIGDLHLLLCNQRHRTQRTQHKVGPGDGICLPLRYLEQFTLPCWHHLKCGWHRGPAYKRCKHWLSKDRDTCLAITPIKVLALDALLKSG